MKFSLEYEQPDGLDVRNAFLRATSFLDRYKVIDASICAEMLLCHLLGWDRTTLFLRWGELFPAEKLEAWRLLLVRRAQSEPVQYIIGEQDFYGLTFAVNPAVLIPRPETELLVEQMIRQGRELFPAGGSVPVLADVGTGSGAIPVTIAANCPEWDVFSSDISPAALEVAQTNASRNGVADRITFLQGSLLLPYIERGLAIDILVSNPPYIKSGDMAGLQLEVQQYEPHIALDGGDDGLSLYREMIAQMRQLPQYPSLVGFEVGQGQAEDVQAMLQSCGHWHEIVKISDLAGIDRHVIGLRK